MRQAHHEHLFVNIFLIIIIGGGKGRKVEWRSGRRDGRGDGTVCEGVVPLGDQGSGETEGFGKVFVSHPVPSHGKLSKDEEGWGGPPVRNERDELRRFKPVPRSFVVHVRYTDESRLLTAWERTLRSILKWVIAIGMAGIEFIGLSKGIQRVRKGYD